MPKQRKFTRHRNKFGLNEPLLYPITLENEEIALGTYLTKYHDIRPADTVRMYIEFGGEKYPVFAYKKGTESQGFQEFSCIMEEARQTRVLNTRTSLLTVQPRDRPLLARPSNF